MYGEIVTAYFQSTEPNRRFKVEVYPDHDASDPTTGDYFECPLTVATSGFFYDDNEGDYSAFKLSAVIERMNGDESPYPDAVYPGLHTVPVRQNREHFERLVYAVNRYAALTGMDERVYLFSHKGHSQSDWATVLVEATSEEEARSHFEMWSEWAKGNVYGVTWETQKLDDEYDVWYTIDTDSVSDIRGFGDDYRAAMEYALKAYAHETLVLTEIEES